MTTTTHPDVPLPAGAYVLCDWDECDNEYRILMTEPKEVEGTNTRVSIDAGQSPDGSFNEPASPPRVVIDRRWGLDSGDSPGSEWCDCLALSAEGACQLARALLRAASQLEEWAL